MEVPDHLMNGRLTCAYQKFHLPANSHIPSRDLNVFASKSLRQ